MNVKIKDYWYTIREVKPYEFVVEPGKQVFGQTDVVKQTIKVLTYCDLERKIKSLIHELSHAYKDALGYVNIEYNEEVIPNFNEVCLIDIYLIAYKYFQRYYGIDICEYFDDGTDIIDDYGGEY